MYGCGGGRYSKFLEGKGAKVLAVDKNEKMFSLNNSINFVKSNMDNLPVKNDTYGLTLSIGVIHNSQSIDEFKKSLNELERVTAKNGYIVLSLFTDDVITDDLSKYSDNVYKVKGRPPMVLLSKEQINEFIKNSNLKIDKVLDEHITNVGIGERNVYTVLLKK